MNSFLLNTILFVFFFSSSLFAQASFSLRGFLNKEQLQDTQIQIEKLHQEGEKPIEIYLKVNAHGGDYSEVLNFAQFLQQQKKKGFHLKLLIEGQASGIAAILPFLTDELYITEFSVWGSLTDKQGSLPEKSILRSQLRSLLSDYLEGNPKLESIFNSMLDPSLELYEKEGQLSFKASNSSKERLLSVQGEHLVLNDRDMKRLLLASHAPLSVSETEDNAQTEALGQKFWGLKQKPDYEYGHLLINDWSSGINESTWVYVQSALKYYRDHPVDFIVMELDTPGGEAYTSQKIADLLRDFQKQQQIPIIAFVHNRAYSAGAMLAYSCQYIATTKQSSLGAAEVVFQTGSGIESAPEKINSAFRADFINRARHFHRNPDLAEAMVDKDVILLEREGVVRKVHSLKEGQFSGAHVDHVLIDKGKLLTLNAEDLIQYGLSDNLLHKAEAWKEAGELESYLASAPNLSRAEAISKNDFKLNWKLQLLSFLVSPAISSFLFLGLMLGFYYEMSSPGVGIPGIIAILCFTLIALSSLSLETFGLLDVLLIVLGFALIFIELFVTPGFAIIGTVGVVLLFMGLVSLLIPGFNYSFISLDSLELTVQGEELLKRLSYLFGAFILLVVFLYSFGKKIFISSPFSALISAEEQNKDQGYVAFEGLENLPIAGSIGEAYTVLRPSGKVKIKQEIFNASSNGEYILKGTRIIVDRLEGSILIVSKEKEEKND
ncbi:MAG: hypothetical protein GWP59_04585 [Chlamydiales bacterium]|nr:hypothetical protein [Chlamydiales bacterium]NCF70961.1 hypothetical protein [Chlamydiales bacterium]